MGLVHRALENTFIFAVKGNRLVVLREEDRRAQPWTRIEDLGLEEDRPCAVWLRGVDFPVAVLRHRHRNVDGSEADVYFVTNELSLSGPDLLALSQKRWQVECYHKSLKQNAAAGRAPLWSVRALANHLRASLCAYARWEALRLKTKPNQLCAQSQSPLRRPAGGTRRLPQPVNCVTSLIRNVRT